MAMRKISTGAIIAIVMLGLVLTLTTAGLLSMSQSLSSSGSITTVNVGVYSDSACTLPLTSISWGTISPNSTVTRTIYVKNTGNTQITLSMTTNGWSPTSANGPITLTWNREGTTLSAGASVAATLTLTVSSSISGITTFSVNIVITGTG
jgi:hypothetical protein